jgi:hypothetical protein
MARGQTKQELLAKVAQLEEELKTSNEAHSQMLAQKESEFNTAKGSLEQQIKEVQTDIENKQKQLNERELKKLAQAYQGQEAGFEKEVYKWFRFVIVALLLLLVSIILSAVFARGEPWYERFEYYLADFVFVTFLIFSLKHYSVANRLRIDFANRKALAQSYHNIISSGDDQEIKNNFISRAAEVLCAPTRVEADSYTVPEKVVEMLAEAVKILSKK